MQTPQPLSVQGASLGSSDLPRPVRPPSVGGGAPPLDFGQGRSTTWVPPQQTQPQQRGLLQHFGGPASLAKSGFPAHRQAPYGELLPHQP